MGVGQQEGACRPMLRGLMTNDTPSCVARACRANALDDWSIAVVELMAQVQRSLTAYSWTAGEAIEISPDAVSSKIPTQ